MEVEQPTTDDLVSEMQAIIHLAETTESAAILHACKLKLKQLSEIPVHNQCAIQTITL